VDLLNPNKLYEELSNSKQNSLNFWGPVPHSFSHAVDLSLNLIKDDMNEGNNQNLEELQTFLISYHKSLGIFSETVMTNISNLNFGSVIVGHQPIIFGGPGFIGNKLACLNHLKSIYDKKKINISPIFFIGDYDGMQKELARVYYPNPISFNATIVSSDGYFNEESDLVSHSALLPPITWLEENILKIEHSINGFKGQLKGKDSKILEERWNHIVTLLKTSFNSTSTLSEWASKLWGTITNIINDFGIVYLPTSHPVVRKLVFKHYLKFIQNSTTYTHEFQQANDQLIQLGFEPSLPHRHLDYSPFILECTNDFNRIPTMINQVGEEFFASGTCNQCKTDFKYNVSNEEELEKIAEIIGPRVDTSQAIFQDLLNIVIRISGPGEIAYYSQVAPAVRSIGFNTPIFVKYKRAYYNSNWNEKLGKLIESRNSASLHNNKLFDILRKRITSLKENNNLELQQSEILMENYIDETYQSLINGKQNNDIQKYLGWQFGRFTKDKMGQEVSWVWIDFALMTGLNDYLSTYQRMYTDESTLGGKYYINTSI